MLSSLLDSFKSFTNSISNNNNMQISPPPNPIKFIEDALFCSGPFALSYSDPDQKWIVWQHLISLFQDFPSLRPSIGVFTHDDGADVKLLNATGELRVPLHAPPVPVTIWVPELYPHVAPIVYINLENCDHPIYDNYPFADSSGAAASPYLKNWHFSRSDLSGLARNLVKLYSHNHPFFYSGRAPSRAHPSAVSKMEAMDRLACSIHYDAAAVTAETGEQIESLSAVQFELRRRAEALEILMSRLEEERRRLKGRREELCEECDKLLNWLKVYGGNSGVFAIDDVFEGLDWETEVSVECSAADLAAEDLMYALDKAVEEGVVSFDVYMKQVRVFAREQFLHRARRRKIEKPDQGFLSV